MSATPGRDALLRMVLDALDDVAPDIDPPALDPARPVRDQVDFDSMDFLNYVTALHDALGIDVPEADYPKLASIAGAVDYLEATLRNRQGAD